MSTSGSRSEGALDLWDSLPAKYLADILLVAIGLAGFLFFRRYSTQMQEIGAAKAISYISLGLVIWASYNFTHLLALAWDNGLVTTAPAEPLAVAQVEGISWLVRIVNSGLMFIGIIGLVQRFASIHAALNEYTGTLEHELDTRSGLETELKAESEKHQTATVSRSEILHSMSHELRTPLNGILGITALLGNTNLTEDQRKLLSMIHKSSSTMLTRVNDFLNLSRLDSGRVKVRATVFKPVETARSVEALFAPLAAEKGLDLTVTHASQITGEFMADEALIKQVVGNLVSNAVKFTDAGTVKLSVDIGLDDDGACWLTFAAVDTGIGLASDDLQRISGPEMPTPENSKGLGLPISHQIATLLGGEITVQSEVGAGSAFTLRLPVERVETVTAV
jgi:signal transduction histidine kinase